MVLKPKWLDLQEAKAIILIIVFFNHLPTVTVIHWGQGQMLTLYFVLPMPRF